MDKAIFRFLFWIVPSSLAGAFTATRFVPLLIMQLRVNFDSVFPAIPFATLLCLLMILRWNDFRSVLLNEGPLSSGLSTRIVGLIVICLLLALRELTNLWIETSGVALVATFYGMSLTINPKTKELMFPYMIIYSAGISMPAILEQGLGGPLVSISTFLSARLVSLFGMPVVWTGSQFTLVSRVGDVVSGTITPGCSSIISITTFLGLLGLMHLDLRKDALSTVKMAVAGPLALFALNSLRITTLIWIGYFNGASALWAIHDWLGYAIFIGFYLAMIAMYAKMGDRTKTRMPSFRVPSWFRI